MRTRIFIPAVLLMVVFLFSSSSAQVPQIINYQGKLTTPGTCALDTTISMTFRIYADSVNFDSLWSETQASVEVEDGMFNVLLGSVTPIPDSVFDGSVRYLGVKVGTDNEMSPRRPLVSAGYAFRSEFADTAEYARAGAADNDWVIRGDTIYHQQGNVGIGTTDPENKLSVSGSISGSAFARFYNSHANGYGVAIMTEDGGNDKYALSVQSVGGYECLTVTNAGRVGIGISAPNARLEVLHGAGFTGSTLKATTAGYKAIHGVGGAGSQAVYGEITGAAGSGQGVMGYVPGTCTAVKGVCTGNGVGGRFESASTVAGNPALYAYNSNGYNYPGLIVYGTSEFNGYATFISGKTGYVVDICQSDDNEQLEEGDVVMVTGVSSPVVGQVPVMKVRKADSEYSTSVVGVVDRKYNKEEKRTMDTAIEKEDYLTAVTLGAYKSIKVDASYAPIEVGDLLTTSSNPGYAMKAINPKVGSIIGKALEPLSGTTGIIKVFVTLK